MKRHYFGTVPVITVAALLSACASTPPENPALNETQAAYDEAVENPEIARNGLSHLRDAETALDRADTLHAEGGDEEAWGTSSTWPTDTWTWPGKKRCAPAFRRS